MSTTASNGPAGKREPHHAIALDTPVPLDGKGVGETGSVSFTGFAQDGQIVKLRDGSRSRSHRRQMTADLRFRYLADALGMSGPNSGR
jgi:hypothetical protein